MLKLSNSTIHFHPLKKIELHEFVVRNEAKDP